MCFAKFGKDEGYSLVEILVAMGLFSIVSLSLLFMFLNSYATAVNSGHKNTAIFDAQQVMEKAITDDTYNEHNIERKMEPIVLFGKSIEGTIVIVKEEYNDENNRSINYVTFVPNR